MNKLLILDTNVLVQEPNCVFTFGDSDIGIPRAVLLELDSLKHGQALRNINARKAVHNLHMIISSTAPTEPLSYPIGPGSGLLRFLTNENSSIVKNISIDSKDIRVLATVCAAIADFSDKRDVRFLTLDIALRVIASTLDIPVDMYSHTGTAPVVYTYPGIVVHSSMPELKELSSILDESNNRPRRISSSTQKLIQDTCFANSAHMSNGFVILSNGQILRFRKGKNCWSCKLVKENDLQIPEDRGNPEWTCASNLLLDNAVPLVVITGATGTRKTLLSMTAAIIQSQKRTCGRLLITRAVPFTYFSTKEHRKQLTPLHDIANLIYQNHPECNEYHKKLNITLPQHVMVSNLGKSIVLIDEAHCLSSEEVKTIVSRAEEDTKIILVGNQGSSEKLQGGLFHLISVMSGNPLFGHVSLTKVERSVLSYAINKLM